MRVPSEMLVNTSRYSELSLGYQNFLSSRKVVYRSPPNTLSESREYFPLKKTPEELRIPLVFRSISDSFAVQWMMTQGQLKSYDDFKAAFTELLWDGTRQSEIRFRVNQDR